MKRAVIAILLVAIVAGGGYAAWLFSSNSAAGYGPATPSQTAADIAFDWFLTEGELSLGTEDIRTPQGVNVRLLVDSDISDTLVIKDFGISQELLPDQVTAVYFYAHKLGNFDIVLKSTKRKVGSLEIYSPTE